jgi:anti-sigma-K factor RskA
MSEALTLGPDDGGDEILAAEYVVGVLPAEERRTVSARIDNDSAFARIVDRWEVYFSPLAVAYAAVEAPAGVKAAVDRRLFSGQASSAPARTADRPGLWASLGFWRGLAAAALAALVIYLAIPFLSPPVGVPENRLIASIAPANSDVAYLAVYDVAKGEVALSYVSGERGTDRDFELWMVEGSNAPVSMGVIPAGASARLPVTPAVQAKLAAGVALAISREPLGGSPTGSPTEVVAAGGLSVI